MERHRIRLRGPWEAKWNRLESGALNPSANAGHVETSATDGWTSRRITMPQDWHSAPWLVAPSRVELRRSFHRPTGLAVGQPVHLVLASRPSVASIRLNDTDLDRSFLVSDDPKVGEPASDLPGLLRWNIGSLLRETNLLFAALVIDAAAPIEQPIWETWLEIFDDQNH